MTASALRKMRIAAERVHGEGLGEDSNVHAGFNIEVSADASVELQAGHE